MPSIRSLCLFGIFFVCAIALTAPFAAASPKATDRLGNPGGEVLAPSAEPWSTVDHGAHEALQQDFNSGPEVTEACLSCHNQAAKQVQETIHWTWVCPADPQGVMGKNGLTMNHF